MRTTDELFKGGKIFDATDAELNNILEYAGMEAIPNEDTRHRQIVRALVVTAVKQQRHIDKIEGRNRIYTWIIIGLSIASIVSNFVVFLN